MICDRFISGPLMNVQYHGGIGLTNWNWRSISRSMSFWKPGKNPMVIPWIWQKWLDVLTLAHHLLRPWLLENARLVYHHYTTTISIMSKSASRWLRQLRPIRFTGSIVVSQVNSLSFGGWRVRLPIAACRVSQAKVSGDLHLSSW